MESIGSSLLLKSTRIHLSLPLQCKHSLLGVFVSGKAGLFFALMEPQSAGQGGLLASILDTWQWKKWFLFDSPVPQPTWICALPIEQAAAQGMLDQKHDNLAALKDDTNAYRFGSISDHNIVMAVLKSGVPGTAPSATVAANILRSFPNIRFGLMVGVGGGVPKLQLGDVVVSSPTDGYGGVIQYDMGRSVEQGRFYRTGSLNSPPSILGTAVAGLRGDAQLDGYQIETLVNQLVDRFPKAGFSRPSEDKLCTGIHTGDDCSNCEGVIRESKEPEVHYGLIGSANRVLQDAALRDKILQELDILSFEMEAGGLMNDFPCLVIRGICDYCDGHKTKQWQPYAAAAAAAYTKQLLSTIPAEAVAVERPANDVMKILGSQSSAIAALSDSMANEQVKLDIKGLPTVPTAAFDSHEDYDIDDSTCLAGTRVEMLQMIDQWVLTGNTTIFWLNGMAGTGKSTIARSVAERWHRTKRLAASFFFKRGGNERQSCRHLFTTVSAQLAQSLEVTRAKITDAVSATPDIGYKALKEQFDKLVLGPLRSCNLDTPMLLVVDALDECEDEDKIPILVSLLCQLRCIDGIKILLTSRKEQYIDFSFQDKVKAFYEDIELHEVTETTVEHDIALYLEHKFDQIKKQKRRDLPDAWPGSRALRAITSMSSPLFIFAATVCRFISHRRSDPVQSLRSIMEGKHTGLQKLHQTYSLILESVISFGDNPDEALQELCSLLGTIVVLAEPLTASAMTAFVTISLHRMKHLLAQLPSVLRISSEVERPIRTLHASFGDYLLNTAVQHKFSVLARSVHFQVALKCLDLLETAEPLSRGDICGLKTPSKSTNDLATTTIHHRLPHELRYACCHWVHHLVEADNINDAIAVRIIDLLETRLLPWFEALSLMNKTREAGSMLAELSKLFSTHKNLSAVDMVEDARRFVVTNSHVADLAPLQLYSSSIIFSPQTSMVRINFPLPTFISHAPITDTTWNPLIQTLEGDSQNLIATPDGKFLASCGEEEVILWNASTGTQHQTFYVDNFLLGMEYERITVIAISSDGNLLAAAINSGRIILWEIKSGQLYSDIDIASNEIRHSDDFDCYSVAIEALAFSPDSQHIMFYVGYEEDFRFCDIASGAVTDLDITAQRLRSMKFAPFDSTLLATISEDDSCVKVWNMASKKLTHILQKHSRQIMAVDFSYTERNLLASVSLDGTSRFWDVATGNARYKVLTHVPHPAYVSFAQHANLVAIGLYGGRITLWQLNEDEIVLVQALSAKFISDGIAFVLNDRVIASNSSGGLDLWQVAPQNKNGIRIEQKEPPVLDSEEHNISTMDVANMDGCMRLKFSPDGRFIAGSTNVGLILYAMDGPRAQQQHFFEHSTFGVGPIFSADSKLILSSAEEDGAIHLHSTITGNLQIVINSSWIFLDAACSAGGEFILTTGYADQERKKCKVELWNVLLKSSEVIATYAEAPAAGLACSSDGKLLAASFDDEIQVWYWDSNWSFRSFPADCKAKELAFEQESSMLHTDLGSIDLHGDADSWTVVEQPSPRGPPQLKVKGEWVYYKGFKVLWLPPAYRQILSGGCIAVYDYVLAFGHAPPKLITMEFDPQELDKMVLSITVEE